MAEVGPAEFDRLILGCGIEFEPELLDAARSVVEKCNGDVCKRYGHASMPSEHLQAWSRLWFASVLFFTAKLRASQRAGSPDSTHRSTPTLSQILVAFDVSLAAFMKEVVVSLGTAEPALLALFGNEPPLERRLQLRELQVNYVYSAVMAKKYRDFFTKVCTLPVEGDGSEVFKLFWTLFLVAKASLLEPFPDLVTSFSMLVNVLNVLLGHLAPENLAFSPTNLERMRKRTPSGAADVLRSLINTSKATPELVEGVATKLDDLLREVLPGVRARSAEELNPPSSDCLASSCVRVEGLLSDAEVTVSITNTLNAHYEQVYRAGQVDERPLILAQACEQASEPANGPGPLPAPSSGAATPSMSKCNVSTPLQNRQLTAFSPAIQPSSMNSVLVPMLTGTPMRSMMSPIEGVNGCRMLLTPSPARGPHNFLVPPQHIMETPVTEAMAAVHWLLHQNMSETQAPEPSMELQRFFSECGEGTGEAIAEGVEQMANLVFPESPQNSQDEVGVSSISMPNRRQCGIRLYYLVLDAMRKGDQEKPGRASFATTIKSPSFHKCMLACAFELVIASYRMVTHTFPTVLERLHLKPFDLCKLISTFVRHLPNLPRELKRHMFSIEEKCLESLSWERGSSLYPLLQTACDPNPSPPDNVMVDAEQPVSPQERKARSPKKMDLTPTKRGREESPQHFENGHAAMRNGDATLAEAPAHANGAMPGSAPSDMAVDTTAAAPLPLAFGRPGGSNAERPGRQVVADFLQRVLRLAYLRITDLCERLDFEPLERQVLVLEVYTMLHYCVYEVTSLLYGRHLDQLLLCALYGVCKVHQLRQITFKDIIAQYKRQPQCLTNTFRSVAIELTPGLQVLETGDVIMFYNKKFIPATKQFVLALGQRDVPIIKPPVIGPTLSSRQATPQNSAGAGLASPPPSAVRNGGSLLVSPLRRNRNQFGWGQSSWTGVKPFTVELGRSPRRSVDFVNTILHNREYRGHPLFSAIGGMPGGAGSSDHSHGSIDSEAHHTYVKPVVRDIFGSGHIPLRMRSSGQGGVDESDEDARGSPIVANGGLPPARDMKRQCAVFP